MTIIWHEIYTLKFEASYFQLIEIDIIGNEIEEKGKKSKFKRKMFVVTKYNKYVWEKRNLIMNASKKELSYSVQIVCNSQLNKSLNTSLMVYYIIEQIF